MSLTYLDDGMVRISASDKAVTNRLTSLGELFHRVAGPQVVYLLLVSVGGGAPSQPVDFFSTGEQEVTCCQAVTQNVTGLAPAHLAPPPLTWPLRSVVVGVFQNQVLLRSLNMDPVEQNRNWKTIKEPRPRRRSAFWDE
ncbi:hypothetical protein DPEC_G00122480 [Dallia pectoralis]|uniref:Uncharacterized protein n=1 Tax=Dallia pectoralis TaxID=75939 RepID=A0ACC2GQ85_DALPE|nr:hypothetical protein DPEC_G00122480 [Dallia pectoralis]